MRIFIALALTLCLFFSCNRTKNNKPEKISSEDLRLFLEDSSHINPWNPNDFNCIPQKPSDTLYRNLPFTYEEAIARLNVYFRQIDSCSYNKSTKQYAKSLVIADFVYAAFSYHFLGPKFELVYDSSHLAIWAAWDTLPLHTCYDIGNSNQTSFYCSQRTSFFLRLVDSLLHIKGSSVPVPRSNHVFPVLTFEAGTFIVDPYDPFIICDSSKKWLVDYPDVLKAKLTANVKPRRTKRLFGNTRQLISKPFVEMLNAKYGKKYNYKPFISCLIQDYLSDNRVALLKTLKPCFEMPDAPLFQTIRIINKERNLYCMEEVGREDGQLRTDTDIVRYYIGLDCSEAAKPTK